MAARPVNLRVARRRADFRERNGRAQGAISPGTGSGSTKNFWFLSGGAHGAAVLAELSGRVWSVEIVEELAGQAGANLRQLGCSDVAIRIGDGSRGWREHAPYDRALLTAAAERLPPAILDQIKPGGRIVLPLGPDEAQRLTVVDKGADGSRGTASCPPSRGSRAGGLRHRGLSVGGRWIRTICPSWRRPSTTVTRARAISVRPNPSHGSRRAFLG